MNQEADVDKPVLNPETFQRLLAAAYLIQAHNDRQPSIQAVQHLGASHGNCFAAGTIVQKRTPSVMITQRQLEAGKPVYRISALLRRPMPWRAVEAFSVAIIFCMIMGLSIHRLLAVPSRTSLASGMLKEQSDFQPKEKHTATSVGPRNTRQMPGGGEADIVAKDFVIRLQERAVNLPRKRGVRLNFGGDADIVAAYTVVQYGTDVTMWSRKLERTTLTRLGH